MMAMLDDGTCAISPGPRAWNFLRVIDTNLQGWKAEFQFDDIFRHLLECRPWP
jgi:hypothetical protein